MIATDLFDYSLMAVCSLAIPGAIPGNITGYWIGRKTGPILYRCNKPIIEISLL
jgi:membrane-associated protein